MVTVFYFGDLRQAVRVAVAPTPALAPPAESLVDEVVDMDAETVPRRTTA